MTVQIVLQFVGKAVDSGAYEDLLMALVVVARNAGIGSLAHNPSLSNPART